MTASPRLVYLQCVSVLQFVTSQLDMGTGTDFVPDANMWKYQFSVNITHTC